jgi:hypothetical protein
MKNPARKDLRWGERVLFAVLGLMTIAYGYAKILQGKPIYENWRGLDISAQFVMFLGAVFLVVAVFPWGRIHFLWDDDPKKRRR